MTSVSDYEIIKFSIKRLSKGKEESKVFDIYNTDRSFRPNRVTENFLDALDLDLSGKVVYDIGSGTGVIALGEAYRDAKIVYAVEPSLANFELCKKNIENHGLEDKIIPLNCEYFSLLNEVPKADRISADVSGIPNKAGRGLGWYSNDVNPGGAKGSEITCELLIRAPNYLKKDGKLYFPTADDLLDANEILDIARDNFEVVENALCTPEQLNEWNKKASESNGRLWKSPEYVWFPLRPEDINNLEKAYDGKIPDTINIQEIKGRTFWRGRIHVAMGPKV